MISCEAATCELPFAGVDYQTARNAPKIRVVAARIAKRIRGELGMIPLVAKSCQSHETRVDEILLLTVSVRSFIAASGEV
jgi:hypothetical protein